jgi:hypothetical protein
MRCWNKEENGETSANRPVYASPLERLGVQSARSFHSHASLTQIASPRNAIALLYRGLSTSVTAGTLCEIGFEIDGKIDKIIEKLYNK